jgi:hypothetical protein
MCLTIGGRWLASGISPARARGWGEGSEDGGGGATLLDEVCCGVGHFEEQVEGSTLEGFGDPGVMKRDPCGDPFGEGPGVQVQDGPVRGVHEGPIREGSGHGGEVAAAVDVTAHQIAIGNGEVRKRSLGEHGGTVPRDWGGARGASDMTLSLARDFSRRIGGRRRPDWDLG